MTRFRRVLLGSAGLVMLATSLVNFILDSRFVTYPRHPDPQAGLTEAYEVKGVIVYVTGRERSMIRYLRYVQLPAVALILVGLIANQIWTPESQANAK